MTTIAQIRKKYPQYADLSDQVLADKFHDKFYSDMPKSDFYSKIGFDPSQLNSKGMSAADYARAAISQAPKPPPSFGQRFLSNAAADLSGSQPDLTTKVGDYALDKGGQILKAAGNAALSLPGALVRGVEQAPVVATAIKNQPGTTASQFLNTVGSNAANIPQNLSHFFLNKDLYQPYQNPDAGTPGASLGNLFNIAAPVGGTTKLISDAVMSGIGKNALSRAVGMSAGGAASAPLIGVSPTQGAGAALLGALPEGVGALGTAAKNKFNQYQNVLNNLAPIDKMNLSGIPQKVYQEAAKRYTVLKNDASNIFNNIRQDPGFAQSGVSNVNTFGDAVQKQISDIEGKSPTSNQMDQLAWLRNFTPDKIKLNNFQDVMNTDQLINDVYKSENVFNNPGLKYQAGTLRRALQQHADDMGDQLPKDLKDQYKQAKNLWVQAKKMETLPNSTTRSPWYMQFKNETDPQGVADGKVDEEGIPIGNPGNFLSNTLGQSGATKNVTAKINHLVNILAPNSRDEIASAYLNPKVSPTLSKSQIANKLNGMDENIKKLIFGDKSPDVAKLQKWANKGPNKALNWLATSAGLLEGMHLGHPFMGYALGHQLPKILNRNTLNTAQFSSANPLSSATSEALTSPKVAQYGIVPGAIGTQQNQ